MELPFLLGVLRALFLLPLVAPALLAFFLWVRPGRTGFGLNSVVGKLSLSGMILASPPHFLLGGPLPLIAPFVASGCAAVSLVQIVRWSWNVGNGDEPTEQVALKRTVLPLLLPYLILAANLLWTALAPPDLFS